MQLGIYQHYKGNFYQVLGFAKHTESLQDLVVYRSLYNDPTYGNFALWARPTQMFQESILINNSPTQRFTFIPNPPQHILNLIQSNPPPLNVTC